MLFAIIGVGFEIAGFILISISTPKLKFKEGDFVSDRYVNPKTGEPPKEIVGPPNWLSYIPGTILVMIGLILQIADIVLTQYLNYPY